MDDPRIRDLDAAALATGGGVLAELELHRALRVRALLERDEAARMTAAVIAARAAWNRDFEGAQFALGRAFYTHLETDRAAEYFREAAASDAEVERHLPGMQARMRALAAAVTGAGVRARPGYCGAGVHVFPAHGLCAREGGDLHFDVEGLTRAQLRTGAPAYSLVLMLQPPARGGALRLWDRRWSPEDGAREIDPASVDGVAFADAVYGIGDLVVLDSHRLHQIQPFDGDRDRVSITLHVARTPSGWESWF